MKIAVSSTGTDLKAQVDPRFGRCAYFVIVDSNPAEISAIPNASASAHGGAGIQSAQFIADQGVDIVLTGSIGPNAISVLNSAGISVFTGISGSIGQALGDYNNGKLTAVSAATASPHSGLGRGRRTI